MSNLTTTYVLGATSLVGRPLMDSLGTHNGRVVALTRTVLPTDCGVVQWAALDEALLTAVPGSRWVSLIPVWHLTGYLDMLADRGCGRLIVLSSTSRFTKRDAANTHDRELAERLTAAEAKVTLWSAEHAVQCAIVRPTMIYGSPDDGNISSLRSAMSKFRVLPLVGPAEGLRQPVHRDDLGALIAQMSSSERAPAKAEYNAAGGETLSYRQMVGRVRREIRGPVVLIQAPRTLFTVAHRLTKGNRFTTIALGMAERMNTDMTFNNADLAEEYGYCPRGFAP